MTKPGSKPAKKTLGEKVKELESTLHNNAIAMQLMQQMIMRFNNEYIKLDGEIGTVTGHLQDLEYRTRALIHNDGLSVDMADLEKKSEEFKLTDFEEASDKEDLEKGYIMSDFAKEDSIVIFTSSVEGKDNAGVFRSKLPLKESISPELKEKLTGTKVGDFVDLDMNGELHHIEVLGIRDLPELLPEAAEAIEE